MTVLFYRHRLGIKGVGYLPFWYCLSRQAEASPYVGLGRRGNCANLANGCPEVINAALRCACVALSQSTLHTGCGVTPNRYFPTILIVLLAVFNDGAMIALSKDRVTPSPAPNSWRLRNIFTVGIVYGLYLTLSSWVLYHVSCALLHWQPARIAASPAGGLMRSLAACRSGPLADCLPAALGHPRAFPPQVAAKDTFFQNRIGLFSLNDTWEELVRTAARARGRVHSARS